MHRDTVIGIVGVVILVAAMVGVFTYERGQASELVGGTDAIANLTGPSADGTVAVGAEAESVVFVEQTGLTNVTFTLTWSPGANSVDTLQLVAAPGADTGLTTGYESDAESDGEITLTIPLNNTGEDGRLGTGNWSLTVRFVNAAIEGPAGPVQPPTQLPAGADTEVGYSIATRLQAYATDA